MLDPTLPEKQRARRRLVGAIALVLAAVIILPMVLDATPKPATGDIAIDIPEQGQGSAPAARTNASLDSGADAVHQDIAAASAASTDNGKANAPAGKTTAATNAANATTTPSTSGKTPNAAAKPAAAAAGNNGQRFAEVFDSASGATDDKSSTAKPGAHAASAADNDLAARVAALPATPATPGARYVVQLGSFESTASAQEWVKKLKRIGVPAFVNMDKAADGTARAQLRAGPFADRTIAQAAVQKVRLAGLSQTADAGGGR